MGFLPDKQPIGQAKGFTPDKEQVGGFTPDEPISTGFTADLERPTGLEKAVEASEKVLSGLGAAASVATIPFKAVAQVSKRGSEIVAESLGAKGVSPVVSATIGGLLAGPEVVVEGAKVPFKALELLSEGTGFLGRKTSEILASRGLKPEVAAGAGTLISMAPDIALALTPLKFAPKAGLTKLGKQIADDLVRSERQMASFQKAIATEKFNKMGMAVESRQLATTKELTVGEKIRKFKQIRNIETKIEGFQDELAKIQKTKGLELTAGPQEQALIKKIERAQGRVSQLSATRQEIFESRVRIRGKKKEPIRLPETLEEARATSSITEKGIPVSKQLSDAVQTADDISPTVASTEGLNTYANRIDKGFSGPFRHEVVEPIAQSVINESEMIVQFINPITESLKRLKIKPIKESVTLRRYIEGKGPAPKGKEAAYAEMKEMYSKATDELRRRQNEFTDRLSAKMTPEQREAAGLGYIERRQDFVHHAIDQNIAADLGISDSQLNQLLKAEDQQAKLQQILAGKKGTPPRGFEKQRLEAIPEAMLQGVVESYESYVTRVARFMENTEHVERLRALAGNARQASKFNHAKFLDGIADRLTGEASMKSSLGAEAATGGLLNKLKLKAAAKLGGRFANNVILANLSALVAQVGAQVLSSIYIGAGRSIQAIPGGLSANLGQHIMKAAGNKTYRTFARQNSQTLKIFQRSKVKSAIKPKGPTETALAFAFDFVNEGMVIGTYNQTYKAAIASKTPPARALQVADQAAARTQAIYADVFRPSVISKASKIGRIMLPFQTYVFNAMNVLKNDVIFSKLSPLQKAQAVGQMAATGILLNLGTNLVTGKSKITAADAVPGLRVAEMGLSGAALGVLLPLKAGASILSGRPKEAKRALVQTATLFGPKFGGFQLYQAIRGAKAISKGKTDKPLRSLLFGPQKR